MFLSMFVKTRIIRVKHSVILFPLHPYAVTCKEDVALQS